MRFKKTAVAVLVLASSTLFAGTMGPVCTAEDVTAPCDKNGWDFGAKALYLKPTYNGDLYLTSFTNASNYTTYNAIDPNWSWGFMFEGSYHFNGGNDINLNWYHQGKSNDRTFLNGTAAAPQNVAFESKHKWDAVNAEFGQLMKYGENKSIRFHGGAQFARISNNMHLNVVGTTPAESVFMKFNGLGVRSGADLAYGWGNGVAVYAKGAAALLYGTSEFNTLTIGILDVNGQSQGSQTTMVPELEGKLGIQYTYCMAQADLTIDGGYMWQNYFNAQTVLTTAANYIANTNFGVQGGYIGIKYMGYT